MVYIALSPLIQSSGLDSAESLSTEFKIQLPLQCVCCFVHALSTSVCSPHANEAHLPPLTSQENQNTLLLMTANMTVCIHAEISVWPGTVGVPFIDTHKTQGELIGRRGVMRSDDINPGQRKKIMTLQHARRYLSFHQMEHFHSSP